MWSDSASKIDLLGYEDLVAEIAELCLNDSLQPLTIGAFADWGAGKSTLLQLAATAIDERGGALVVEFSPWQVESYDDVKSCLLDAVVETIAEKVDVGKLEKAGDKAAELVKKLRGRISWMRLAKLGASAVVPLAGVGLDALDGVLQGKKSAPAPAASSAVSRQFHEEFGELINGLEDFSTVVVLVDDLDRCLPDQIIETLEAIRLFLATPGTAFVIAADERLVRDAVRHRYASAIAVEVDLPRDYLEKLVHVALRIPPLTRVDAESYCNLLVADRRLPPEDFEQVLAAAVRLRSSGELQVACNVGIAREALQGRSLPAAAEADFGLVAQIIGPLSSGLNGNPRQIKRFMNTLDIRRRTAKRRAIEVDDSVLAKLTVLEYVRDGLFRQLHAWQVRGGGVPEELSELEASLDSLDTKTSSPEFGTWASDMWMRDWLAVEPLLAGRDLSPYFFLARDRLGSASAQTSQLSPHLQALAGRLGDTQSATREAAVDEAIAIDAVTLLPLIQACGARLAGLPDKQPMMRSMVEISEHHPALVESVVAAFAALAYPEVPTDIPLVLAGRLNGGSVTGLLEVWEKQGSSAMLSKLALTARTKLAESNGHE